MELTRHEAAASVRKRVRFRAGETTDVDLSALETLVGGRQADKR